MSLIHSTTMRSTGGNIPTELRKEINAAITELEEYIEQVSDSQGLRRAVVRSRLDCSSIILLDQARVTIVAEVAMGVPQTHYLTVQSPDTITVQQGIGSGIWDFGFSENCFALQFPRNLLAIPKERRMATLMSLAQQWVSSEEQRMIKESQLIQISPIFGPASYVLRDDFCFVIGPFSDKATATYKSIIRPTVIETGLSCHRADEMFTNRAIMSDIWQALCEARIVIADLSDKSPNVYYELGIAHTLGKDTIMISSKDEERIPFDIQGIRQIRFENSPVGGIELREALTKTIQSLLAPTILS